MRRTRAFTIVELLVVVSIIALLIGILLPAIGKAREQAQLTKSQANLRQLGQAAATYAAEWNDRQFTLTDDNLARYGNSVASAVANYSSVNGAGHPDIWLGWAAEGDGVRWQWAAGLATAAAGLVKYVGFATAPLVAAGVVLLLPRPSVALLRVLGPPLLAWGLWGSFTESRY